MTDFNENGFARKRRQDELLKVAEQAAAWLIELEDGEPSARAGLASWLEESPLHVEMFLRASSVDRITELMAPEDVRALSRSLLVQRKGGSDASPLPLPLTLRPDPHPSRSRGPLPSPLSWRGWKSLAAGVVALVCGAVWYGFFGPNTWDDYTTRVGEQRTVSLPDGSVIYVNTDSRVDVHYTEGAREVRLRSGEALFKVERDAHRPFQVHVGDAVVQAIGTQFNIYRRSGETTVSVIEGSVQLSKAGDERGGALTPGPSPASGRGEEIQLRSGGEAKAGRLAAGQGVRLGKDGVLEKSVAVNVAQVTAWRQRRLVFEWQTLGEITAEFNRYNRAPQIRVDGDDIRARRYTAVFDADNPQTLLRFLSKDDQIKFAAEGDDFVIRGR